MRRLPPLALALLATAAAVAAGWPLREAVLARSAALVPGTEVIGLRPAVSALPVLIALLLVGRTALAWLPAGRPGGGRLRELSATWAASFVLGDGLLQSQLGWYEWLGLTISPLSLAGPWVALLLLRLASLPGGAAPRHEPNHEAPDSLARATLLGWLSMAIFPAFLIASSPIAGGPDDTGVTARLCAVLTGDEHAGHASLYLGVARWIALLTLASWALAASRRAPSGRRAVVLLLAMSPFVVLAIGAHPELTLATTLFGAGCACLIPWLRRADERAGSLSVLAFLACAFAGGHGLRLAASGLVVLFVFSATRRARARLLRVLAPGLLLPLPVLVPALSSRPRVFESSELGSTLTELGAAAADRTAWGLHWPLVLTALVWGTLASFSSRSDATPGSETGAPRVRPIDPPRREFLALASLLGVTALIELPWSEPPADLLMLLAPSATLAAGLALVRTERV